MNSECNALVSLGQYLKSQHFSFTAITPLTHQRAMGHGGAAWAARLQDIFGWSRPFRPDAIFAPAIELLEQAGELERDGELLRSGVRFATLGQQLYVHSAYPTLASDAVFFGPDTYRFARAIRQFIPSVHGSVRLLDIGCGSGAGGLVAAELLGGARCEVVLSDINRRALRYARVNAEINGVKDVVFACSDLFEKLEGSFDVIISNPPYLVDPLERAYRHGGANGFDLSLRIVEESLDRLAPGGRLILYTGTPVIDGADQFCEVLTRSLTYRHVSFSYEEIDPDVFGEELESAAYQHADRIAAVCAVVDVARPNSALEADSRWLKHASDLNGPGFATFQRNLTEFNHARLNASFPSSEWRAELRREAQIISAEGEFLEALRAAVAPLASDIPTDPDAFIDWYESLKDRGPGQSDPLFPWLARQASYEQMRWFLLQEVAGEAGFEDLLAVTQVKISEQAKLEMARNYWDEMGRGAAKGMHGPMLTRLAEHFQLAPTAVSTVPESLALGNCMIGMAANRRYAFHSIGALGVIEMTAPGRAKQVDIGLRRLGVPAKKRHYFALHSVLDVKHSEAWNREVLRPLVEEDSRRAQAIGEGALMRLWHGARCFERYRKEFNFDAETSVAA
jgi:methylase of polypeptide subunit release factors